MSYKYSTVPPSERSRDEKSEEAENDEDRRFVILTDI